MRIRQFNNIALLWESMKLAGKEVKELTPILFSSESSGLSAQVPPCREAGIHCLARKYRGKLYLVTVNAEYRNIHATFSLPHVRSGSTVKVLFEERSIDPENGFFEDDFGPYERHVYEISSEGS